MPIVFGVCAAGVFLGDRWSWRKRRRVFPVLRRRRLVRLLGGGVVFLERLPWLLLCCGVVFVCFGGGIGVRIGGGGT